MSHLTYNFDMLDSTVVTRIYGDKSTLFSVSGGGTTVDVNHGGLGRCIFRNEGSGAVRRKEIEWHPTYGLTPTSGDGGYFIYIDHNDSQVKLLYIGASSFLPIYNPASPTDVNSAEYFGIGYILIAGGLISQIASPIQINQSLSVRLQNLTLYAFGLVNSLANPVIIKPNAGAITITAGKGNLVNYSANYVNSTFGEYNPDLVSFPNDIVAPLLYWGTRLGTIRNVSPTVDVINYEASPGVFTPLLNATKAMNVFFFYFPTANIFVTLQGKTEYLNLNLADVSSETYPALPIIVASAKLSKVAILGYNTNLFITTNAVFRALKQFN